MKTLFSIAAGLVVGIACGLAYTHGAPVYAVLPVLLACCFCIGMMRYA